MEPSMMVILNPAPPEDAQSAQRSETLEKDPEASPFQEQIELLRDAILRLQDRIDQLEEGLKYDIALDRRRITKLEGPEGQQPKQKDRSDTLRLLLAANGGKLLAKDARHKLDLTESQFSQLINSMQGLVESRPLHSDRRQHVITLVKALSINLI
jgi:hypothetical protein